MPVYPAGDTLIRPKSPTLDSTGVTDAGPDGRILIRSPSLKAGFKHLDSRDHDSDTQRIIDEQIASHALNSRPSGLPPTPPSQNGDHFDEPLLSPSMLSDAYYDAFSSPRMQVSTPVHLTSPPTPDTTPPSTRKRLRVPNQELVHYPSLSQADSFVTARETLRSQSSDRSQSFLSAREGELSAQSSRQLFSSLPGVIVPSNDQDVGSPKTPRANGLPRSLEHSPSPNPRREVKDYRGDIKDVTRSPRWSLEPSVNGISTPRTTDGSSHSRNTSITSIDKISESPRRKPRQKRHHELHTIPSPSKDSLPAGGDEDSPVSHDALYTHLRDEKSKRLSTHSTNSTVVEAIVYSSPTKPRRELRHAGKNLALRKDEGKSGTRRVLSDSHDTTDHRLRHRRTPLPGRGLGTGHLDDVDEKQRAVSTPEIIERDFAHPIPPPLERSPEIAVRTLSKHAKRLTPPDWPLRTQRSGSSADRASPIVIHDEEEEEESIPRPRPTDKSINGGWVSGGSPEFGPDADSTRAGWRRGEDDDELASPPPRLAETNELSRQRTDSLQEPDKQHGLLSVRSNSGSDAAPRVSMDRLTATSSRRGSLEPRMDYANVRQISSNHTPLSERSQWSDRTHNAEVSQATAVNIYPHHNESLLIVQQHGTNGAGAARPHDFPSPEITPPEHPSTSSTFPAHPKFEAFLDTGTPPLDSTGNATTDDKTNIDSPLLNPRAAPQPPVIQFIPPTPNDEADRQLSLPDDAGPFSMNSTAPLPKRRASLRERAKAHSAALVDAVLFRHPSTASRKGLARRRTISGAGGDVNRPRNLHPFWRPRGFWDDFDSDADADDDEGNLDAVDGLAEEDRLPAGGDTSDVEGPDPAGAKRRRRVSLPLSFPRQMSTRLPGFRGSGGFLVGNSLGLGRHGTNSRRPHISLPLRPGGAGAEGGSGPRARSSVPGQDEGLVTVRRRRSERTLRTLGGASRESLRRAAGGLGGGSGVVKGYAWRRGAGGMVGMRGLSGANLGGPLRGLRERVRAVGVRREERKAEERRERLRGRIGVPRANVVV